jgi:4'-phosphopantetheinyl transferase
MQTVDMRGESIRTRHTIPMTDAASALTPGDVSVYHADVAALASTPGRVERWHGWLTAGERARFERFRHDADRMMFLCGRGMARELVARALGTAPDAWQWREGPHGRPEIASPETPLCFNVAHSAGFVACGLALGGDVGVDIEDRRRAPVDRGLVRRYCSPAEADDIESQRDDGWHDRFLEYWTLKEAYLKARGLGIAVPLSEISFTRAGDAARVEFLGSLSGTDADWTLTLFRPSPHHVGAVATRGVVPQFHRFE